MIMNRAFCVDIETLGTESTSVVLSAAIVWFEIKPDVLVSELRKQSCFVKFRVREQIYNYDRITSIDTQNWWRDQSQEAKEVSLLPTKNDMSVIDGIEKLRSFYNDSGGKKSNYIYSRGTLDSTCLDSLCRVAKIPPLWHYAQHRDVRSVVDCMFKKSYNGNVKIDKSLCQDYDENLICLHNPIDDCIKDICMLIAGEV